MRCDGDVDVGVDVGVRMPVYGRGCVGWGVWWGGVGMCMCVCVGGVSTVM